MKYFLRIINFQIIYLIYSITLYTRKMVIYINKWKIVYKNLYKEMEYFIKKTFKI